MAEQQKPEPRLITARHELRQALAEPRRQGKTIGLVATMGALHAGHMSLVEACCRECDVTVVSVFVNPTQFGPGEDYERYPRALQADLALLREHPVDLVFAPQREEVYRPGHATNVEVQGVATVLEGERRPGHFRGVATVVLKLLNLVGPHRAYFGQKDYQQTLVVKQMVKDLDVPVQIRVCPTVREPDGLALSSRNVYLAREEREEALALSRSLRAGAAMVEAGERCAAAVLERMREVLGEAPGLELDYLVLADCDTLEELTQLDRPSVALIAARVGRTRLIDNLLLPHPTNGK